MSKKITADQIDETIEKLRIAFSAPTKEAFISELANRFLIWKLPSDFNPDCGIMFKPDDLSWPMGTNLFDHDQAKQMVRHMLTRSK